MRALIVKRELYFGLEYSDCCNQPAVYEADEDGDLSPANFCMNCKNECNYVYEGQDTSVVKKTCAKKTCAKKGGK